MIPRLATVFLRDARMCNRRCLHSSMIGMLCIAFWGPSQTIHSSESSVLIPDWTDCRFGFVVDLVEEHVGLVVLNFSVPILERLFSAHASQQNVVTLEFGSPCSPRSALFAHDLNRHSLQRVAPIYPKKQFLREKNLHRSPGNGTFFFHLARFSCQLQQRVAPIYRF